MPEKRIVIDIDEHGQLEAETFDMEGTECLEELDKLLKNIALETSVTKKDDYYKSGVSTSNKIKVNK